ncbi:helix-turn-helix transcriptional regulator [Hyphomonas pacifica]|uniref:helix-turn-helix transcriptional regulator n=1 Tax=Hyphomonas pacifica TaxID=1280941 RepID=UPI002D767021|nr:helix-turn-helix domain-containing protein [Hyphomonas pacifica]
MEYRMLRHSTLSLLNTRQAAERLGLSARTLESLRVSGGGPEYIKLGRSVRYEHDAIETWIEDRKMASTSEYNG